jgi:hypothetical protein
MPRIRVVPDSVTAAAQFHCGGEFALFVEHPTDGRSRLFVNCEHGHERGWPVGPGTRLISAN